MLNFIQQVHLEKHVNLLFSDLNAAVRALISRTFLVDNSQDICRNSFWVWEVPLMIHKFAAQYFRAFLDHNYDMKCSWQNKRPYLFQHQCLKTRAYLFAELPIQSLTLRLWIFSDHNLWARKTAEEDNKSEALFEIAMRDLEDAKQLTSPNLFKKGRSITVGGVYSILISYSFLKG